MAQLINIRKVSVPGIGKLPLADSPGTFSPSGPKRTPKAGRLPGDGGFVETSVQAQADLNLNLQGGISLSKLMAIANVDVTVSLSDGTVHMMTQAFAVAPTGVADGDSKLTLVSDVSEQIV